MIYEVYMHIVITLLSTLNEYQPKTGVSSTLFIMPVITVLVINHNTSYTFYY